MEKQDPTTNYQAFKKEESKSSVDQENIFTQNEQSQFLTIQLYGLNVRIIFDKVFGLAYLSQEKVDQKQS